MGTLNLGGATLSAVGGNWTSAPPGTIIQVVQVQDGAFTSGTTLMPIDDTIPQNTEGIEFMSLAITPTSATSKLLITVNALLVVSSVGWITGALFQDSGADAITSWTEYQATSGASANSNFSHYMTAGTTSATTFKFRAGKNTAGTTYFNGSAQFQPFYSGTAASSITIMEIAA